VSSANQSHAFTVRGSADMPNGNSATLTQRPKLSRERQRILRLQNGRLFIAPDHEAPIDLLRLD
jgi:hypothetical protein